MESKEKTLGKSVRVGCAARFACIDKGGATVNWKQEYG